MELDTDGMCTLSDDGKCGASKINKNTRKLDYEKS
jgi:hypothetical protein